MRYQDLYSDRWLLVMSADDPAACGQPSVEQLGAMLQEQLVRRLPPEAGLRTLPCPIEVSPSVEAMW